MQLSVQELADMTLMALRAGFADAAERQSLEHDFKAEMAALGILAG
jgi:hypothetical protein